MFNLEQAIAKWRRQMAGAGIESSNVLDELENHLREDIARQIQSGANDELAYQAAVHRIGKVSALKAEFAKVNKPTERGRKLLRAFYFLSVTFVLLVNTCTLLEYEMSPRERWLGFFTVLLVVWGLAWLPHLLNTLPAERYVQLVKVIKAASSLVWVWPIWVLLEAQLIVHSEIGIIPTMTLWCLCAAIALSALAYGCNDRRPASGDFGGPHLPFQPPMQPIPPIRPCPPDFGVSLPPAQSFAPIAREALEAAAEEASRLGHDFIGTEHVLLGVLKLAKGAFADALQKIHLDRETVRMEIESLVSARPARGWDAAFAFTPRTRKALQLAAREADTLDHRRISAEHIFLGLLLEGGGVAARVLRKLGVHLGRTRSEMLTGPNAHRELS